VGHLAADVVFPVLGEGKTEDLPEALAAAIESAALLEVAGEDAFARGFASLARVLHARGEAVLARGTLPSFADADRGVRSRLAARWEADARTRPLAARVRGEAPAASGVPAVPGLPEPRELPFRLDALDPLREAGGGPR
jgi:hypothetical protein